MIFSKRNKKQKPAACSRTGIRAPLIALAAQVLLAVAFFAVHNSRSAAQPAVASTGRNAKPAPLYAITRPNPAPEIPLPQSLPVDHTRRGPNRSQIEQLTPTVEVWRPGSNAPQIRQRRRGITETAYVTGKQPVLLRLQFDARSAGKLVTVTASSGVVFEPPEAALAIRPTGECVVSVRLIDGYSSGHIAFDCQGLKTSVPLQLTSASVVARHETEPGQ